MDLLNELYLVFTRLLTIFAFLYPILLWRAIRKQPVTAEQLSARCAFASFLLWAEVMINGDDMLRNFLCIRERIFAPLSVVLGVCFAVIALRYALIMRKKMATVIVTASLCTVGLLGYYAIYLDNMANYEYLPQFHVLVQKGTCLNPPEAMIQPGDIVLDHYDNPFAEPFGHGEIAVLKKNGKLGAFTDRKETGIIFRDMSELIEECHRDHRIYAVFRIRQGVTEAQKQAATKKAYELLEWNICWKRQTNAKIDRLNAQTDRLAFNALLFVSPLQRRSISAKLHLPHQTGYNWIGLVDGMDFPPLYTCISIVDMMLTDSYQAPIQKYGKGAFGLFGVLNPKYPCRYAGDSALRVLTVNDKAQFEKLHCAK